jgi:hypothetical protein
MIDDEEDGAGARDAELLLYDYFKHLTSLSLFSLGGVLALAEKTKGTGGFAMLISVVLLIGAGAILSFSGASEIVRARFRREAVKHVDFCRIAAPALLSLGVGGFIYLFAKTMMAA